MTFHLANRVRMTLTGTAGTGTLSLNTPAVGFQNFDTAGLSDGDTTAYVIEDGNPVGAAWEIGVGTWHSNQTFSRTTVTQSSAGGTTKISATANAIVSACFRAQEFSPNLSSMADVSIISPTAGQLLQFNAGTSKWENKSRSASPSTPTIVQSTYILNTTSGAVNMTLGSAPTPGNLLLTLGFGMGQTGYASNFYGVGSGLVDRSQSWSLSTQYDIGYSAHVVRSGETTTQLVGSGDPGGVIPNAAVMVELAGVDLKSFHEGLASRRSIPTGGGSNTLSVLAPTGALCLAFVGGDSGLSTSGFTSVINQTSGGFRVRLASDVSTHDYDSVTVSLSTGTANALLMALVGV